MVTAFSTSPLPILIPPELYATVEVKGEEKKKKEQDKLAATDVDVLHSTATACLTRGTQTQGRGQKKKKGKDKVDWTAGGIATFSFLRSLHQPAAKREPWRNPKKRKRRKKDWD